MVDPSWAWAHDRLIAAYMLGGDDGLPRDLSRNHRDATGFDDGAAAGTLISTPIGDGRNFPGATAEGIIVPNVAVTDQLSVFALVRTDGDDGNLDFRHVFSRHPGWYMVHNSTSSELRLVVETSSGVSTQVAPIADYADGIVHLVGGTYDGATVQTYFDGLPANSNTQTGNIDLTGNTRIAGYWDSTAFEWYGDIMWVAYWSRAFSAEEVLRLSIDPFGPFRGDDEAGVVYATAVARFIRSNLQSRKNLRFDVDRLVSTGLISAGKST